MMLQILIIIIIIIIEQQNVGALPRVKTAPKGIIPPSASQR